MEEGVCGANVFKSGSKSSIGPKSDNLSDAIEKKEADKCKHFSIRAFVGEVRRKDQKICWPFPLLGDNEESNKESDMLPPMHVPEFRWWGCQNCLQRTDASDDAADIRLVSNCYPSAGTICGSRNSDVNTSVDVIDSEICPLTHDHMKEKVTNVKSIIRRDMLSSENYSNIVVNDVDRTMKESISSEMKVAQVINVEFNKGAEGVNLTLENSELVEFSYKNDGSSQVCKGILKCVNNSFTEVFRKEKGMVSIITKPCEQVKDMKCHQKPELRTLENEVVRTLIGFHTSKDNPLESIENEDDKDAHGFSSQVFGSRKPQKFRLLSEILSRDISGAYAKFSSSNRKTCFHDVNSKVTQTKSADDSEEPDGLGLDIPSGGQISGDENVEMDTAGSNKKRKALHIEDREQMKRSKSLDTNVRIYKSNKENTSIDSAVANSKSAKDAFIWNGLHGDFKSQSSPNKPERKVIQGKRKNKTTQLSDDGSAERVLHPSLTQGVDLNHGVVNDRATYRKDVVSDLKANTVLTEGDRPTTCQDVNCMSSKTNNVPAKRLQEKASRRGLHSFVKYCMAAEETAEESALKNQKHEGHQVGSGTNSVMTHNSVMPIEDKVISKKIGHATKVASGPGSPSGLKIEKATPRKSSWTIKQNSTSKLQDGASPIWSKDLPFIYSFENKTDVQGHSEAKDQSNGRADKTNESESLNGIPVEIVELLAKNRHERRRLEAENAKENKLCLSTKTKNVTDSEISEFSGFHEKEMLRYPSGHKMLKPQSNAVGSMSAAGRSVMLEPVEESIACFSHLKKTFKSSGSKIKQSEGPHDTKGAFAFSDSPVNLSSGNLFSEAGTSKKWGVKSCRWDEDKLVDGYPNSSFQCSTSCHQCQIVPSPTQRRGAHHVSMLDVADCPFRIESSQKSATLSQAPNWNINLETFQKINEEQPCACTNKRIGNSSNPIGQLELCSNETLPATQLLKLMDAGMSTKVSRKVDKNMEFTNQASFPHISHRSGIFPLNGGLRRDSSAHKGGRSSEYFTSVPISDPFAFPGQRDKNCVGRRHILGQVSEKMVNDRLKSKETKRRKHSDYPTAVQDADSKLHRFGDGSGGLGQKKVSFHIDGLKAEFHLHSNSMMVPSKSGLVESSIGNVEVENKVGTVALMEGSCGTVKQLIICSLNRNPADFSIPEARNEFTIRGGDFKPRKMDSKRGRPRLRMMKLQAIKESAQH
ncbi:uncharacterized protein LOC131336458 [Rhododendron vialii]|uniref:uncharacterized protein LOC131336458 n=1 Tax=Rhododendron vialii TaxID=182163 RepID=UPI00265EFF81|nr:uncharacterized protein LOC131336458 [Rhododendron vialii]